MPGVPDFYQGTEFWDLSLVDPDNRRPVDFAARQDGARRRCRCRLARAGGALDGRPDQARAHAPAAVAAQRVAGAVSRWQLRAGRGDRARIATTSSRSAARRDATAWWSPSARHFARMTDGGNRWPDGDWQAELKLDRRHRQGLRDALGASGAECRESGHFAAVRRAAGRGAAERIAVSSGTLCAPGAFP